MLNRVFEQIPDTQFNTQLPIIALLKQVLRTKNLDDILLIQSQLAIMAGFDPSTQNSAVDLIMTHINVLENDSTTPIVKFEQRTQTTC